MFPAVPRLGRVVLGALLREAIEGGEAGLRAARGGKQGHADPVPVRPLPVRVSNDLAERQEILLVELWRQCGADPRAPALARKRDQGLELLDRLGGIDLHLRPEIDDASQARLILAMPAAGPSQRMGRRHGCRIGPREGASQRAGSLERSMLGPGAGGLATTPVQVQLILDLAGLRVSPATARGDHDGRPPEHELQVPPRDRRRMVGLDREHQAVSKVVLTRAVANEGRDRRSEHRRAHGVGRLRCLVRSVVDDWIEARAVERHPYGPQHLARALGEGAQDRIGTVIGVPKRRIDKARDLCAIGRQTNFCGHGRCPMGSGRALAPFME